jgi:hypothetical protein
MPFHGRMEVSRMVISDSTSFLAGNIFAKYDAGSISRNKELYGFS